MIFTITNCCGQQKLAYIHFHEQISGYGKWEKGTAFQSIFRCCASDITDMKHQALFQESEKHGKLEPNYLNL